MEDKNVSINTNAIVKEIGSSTKLINAAVASMPDLQCGKGLDGVDAAIYMMGYGCASSAQNLMAAINNKILKMNDEDEIEEFTAKFHNVTVLLQSAVSMIEDIAEENDMEDVLYFRDYRVDNQSDNRHLQDLMDQHILMTETSDDQGFH